MGLMVATIFFMRGCLMVKLFKSGKTKNEKLRTKIAETEKRTAEIEARTEDLLQQARDIRVEQGLGGVGYEDMSVSDIVRENQQRMTNEEIRERAILASRLRARTRGGSRMLMASGANSQFSPFSTARQTTTNQTVLGRNPRTSS